MKEDKEQLQIQLKEKIDKKYSKADSVDEMLQSVLENFAYRYIASDGSDNLKAMQSGEHSFFIESFEKNMKQALRSPHQNIYKGIVALLQRIPLKKNPAIKYMIDVQLIQKKDKKGRGKVRAWVSWDYPSFSKSNDHFYEKEEEFSYDDFMELRTIYPKALEKVCEIF